jgi:hypothetical protein
MELVALIGTDKEAWGQVTGLINRGTWEKVILIKTKDGREYVSPQTTEEIIIDSSRPLLELKKEIADKLKPHLSGFEAILSVASGNGKEHMALIAALLSIPVGIRLAAFTKNGVEFIN